MALGEGITVQALSDAKKEMQTAVFESELVMHKAKIGTKEAAEITVKFVELSQTLKDVIKTELDPVVEEAKAAVQAIDPVVAEEAKAAAQATKEADASKKATKEEASGGALHAFVRGTYCAREKVAAMHGALSQAIETVMLTADLLDGRSGETDGTAIGSKVGPQILQICTNIS